MFHEIVRASPISLRWCRWHVTQRTTLPSRLPALLAFFAASHDRSHAPSRSPAVNNMSPVSMLPSVSRHFGEMEGLEDEI